jgi:disulfide bond formation protein DsbB
VAGPLTQGPRPTLRADLSVILAPRNGLIICGAMSTALLAAAFLFEYVGGMAPCSLCIWQRWAHVAVIGAALIGMLILPARTGLLLAAAAALTSFGVAGYHAGVEWALWDGPSGCTANLGSAASSADLVDQLLATPVIRCDDVPWSLFGLSMAGWNALLSLDITAVAILAFIFGGRIERQT